MPAPVVAVALVMDLPFAWPGIEQLARVVVPHRLGHFVDELLVLLVRRDPLRADRDRLHFANALVGVRRHGVRREKLVLRAHLVDFGPGERHEVDATAGSRQFGNGAGRKPADEEIRVEAAVAQFVAGLVGLQVLRA